MCATALVWPVACGWRWSHCAADLLAWAQTLLFTGELRVAEPRTLRYRILHIAARLIRSARRTWLRLPEHWPWTADLLDAYRRLATIA